MVYVFVLFGSLFVISAILGGRVLLRHRSVRKFVRGVRMRVQFAEERGALSSEETPIEKQKKSPRTTAIELQKIRSCVHAAERAQSQDNLDEAESLYIQALTVNPDAHEVRAALAKLYLTSGRDAKAEAMYRELLQSNHDASHHANLGLAYYRQEKFNEAYLEYQEALEHDPNNPDRLGALGRVCIALQRFGEAIPLLGKASTRLPRDTEILRLLAQCYEQVKDPAQAIEAYQRVNKLEPYDKEIKEKLATLTIS